MSHTPGPWIIAESGDAVFSDDPNCPLDIVCEAPGKEYDSRKFWPANARLIAAAPDMLKYIRSSASAGCATARQLLASLGYPTCPVCKRVIIDGDCADDRCPYGENLATSSELGRDGT